MAGKRNKFKVGDKVMAKWPGTVKYYPGKVLDYNDIEYLVTFDDDEESHLAIKYKDVIAPIVTRSSRSKSRGRSPGRKSPSRKSPGRKSPGRTKTANQNNITAPKFNSSASDEEKTTSRRSMKIETSTPIRQSARLAEKVTTESKLNHTRVSQFTDSTSSQKSTFGFSNIVSYVLPTLKTLPMFLFLLVGPFILNQMCTKKKCSITQLSISYELKHYFDLTAALIVVAFVLAQALLSFAIPLGTSVKLASGKTMRMNCIFVLLVNLMAIPLLLRLKFDVLLVYTLYRQLMVSCIVLGITLSIAFYIKGKYASKSSLNPQGNTGHFLPDFLEGKEVTPSLGPFDIKYLFFRIFLMSVIMLNIIIIMKDVNNNKGIANPTLFMSAALQIIYCLDYVWFEQTFITTYEYQTQGTGFLVFVGYLSGSFYSLILTKYVMNHRSLLPWQSLVGIGIINTVGYIIMRGSNSQKHKFRTSPTHYSHLESLPTATGKRLLVSGYWGFVRHPNYLGDIIIQISWGLMCGFNHGLPWLLVGLDVLYLISRVFIVEASCKAKYRHAWDNYTSRVKYRLIPRIF